MFPIRDSVPSRTFPFVNYALIAVNVAVFLKEAGLAARGALEAFIGEWGLVPSLIMAHPGDYAVNVFTSMFLHGGWGHLLSNMWFLHVFGDNVEDNLGHGKYLFFYLIVGIGAAAAQVWANPGGRLPMVGASGAIAGVLGGYFILHPGARVLTLVPIFYFIRFIEIPAFFFLGIWFLIQAVNGVGALSVQAVRGEMGGVAWWAHAGGFAAGFIATPLFRLFSGRRRSYF